MKLSPTFYQRDDVCLVARELLGKTVATRINDRLCKAMITETEAYNGRTDRACHAYGGRRTQRTEVMYTPGGVSYVYLCYGIHHLFNVVTNAEDRADAVLIRAVEPLEGTEHMLERRRMQQPTPRLTAGPGSLSQALGITTALTGTSLDGDVLWIEEGIIPSRKAIHSTTRIGVDYAGSHARFPWRYYLKNNVWVSKK